MINLCKCVIELDVKQFACFSYVHFFYNEWKFDVNIENLKVKVRFRTFKWMKITLCRIKRILIRFPLRRKVVVNLLELFHL